MREKEEREGNESESEEALFYKRDEEMTSPGGLQPGASSRTMDIP